MKYLFVARRFTQFRNYDSVLHELVRRGHRVHLAVERADGAGDEAVVRALADGEPGISYGLAPGRPRDEGSDLVRRLRLGLDYLRYTEPAYDAAPLLRERARLRTPRALAALSSPPILGGSGWRRAYGGALHRLERALEPPGAVVDFLRDQAPDALLITPLIELGSQQVDYVRAARRLGIPSGFAVYSWDNLTSKARLHECPERVYVWNDLQRREAIEAHDVPADRIVVTGAQCFDRWFARQPSRTRAELCAAHGLDPARPIVLYVGSGLIQGSPPELPFAREWLGWVRGSADPLVATANVLVRPHPNQAWQASDLGTSGPLAVWGANPIDARTRDDYFDSLHHSDVVVGLNTSAFLEAGIAGREVLAVLVPRFHDNQDGTLHFRYLREVGGGLLRVAGDREAHLAQLGEVLRRRASADHPHRAFLEAFVRPEGLDVPATPILADAIEALPAVAVTVPAADPARAAAAERRLRAAAALLGDAWTRSPRELEPARRAVERERRRERDVKRRVERAREREALRQRRRDALQRARRQAAARAKTVVKHALVATGLLKPSS